jgi:pimeloyl-ACP methyl ester carboxylesterase
VERRQVSANGVEFTYLTDGPPDGPLALCLHGFPDTPHTWRHLLPRLADAGYHAVAPFMRGYAPTEVPPDGRYDTGTLALDACALHETLGGSGDAVIIGHDWGAFATYGAAAYQPERWRRVVGAGVAPQASMAEGFLTYDQLRRSWYIFFFQTAFADLVVPMNDFSFIDRLWADWSPGYDASSDTPAVKEALRSTENLAAAIGYYRAMISGGPPDDPESAAAQAAGGGIVPQPTLYLHGGSDGCIGVETIGQVADFLGPGSEVVVIEGASHFLHLQQPDEVNDRIIRFVTG